MAPDEPKEQNCQAKSGVAESADGVHSEREGRAEELALSARETYH